MVLEVLENQVIKYLLLTRLQKCQHILKWCNLLRMLLPFVCLKERSVWLGPLWWITSKHNLPPTFAEDSEQNLWWSKAGRLTSTIIYFFCPMTFSQKWNSRWWFASSLRCHRSLSRSILQTACILSPFRSKNVRVKWNICHFATLCYAPLKPWKGKEQTTEKFLWYKEQF